MADPTIALAAPASQDKSLDAPPNTPQDATAAATTTRFGRLCKSTEKVAAAALAAESDANANTHALTSNNEDEQVLAASILNGMRSERPDGDANKQPQGPRAGPRRVSSARMPGLPPAPPPFEVIGPWKPSCPAEQAQFDALLDGLVSENKNITYWTHARLKKSVAAIFAVLKCAPYGLARIELRNAARQFVGDTGLLDYTIKVLVNREVAGFYMRRETDENTGKLLYYAGYTDPAAAPAIAPRPPHTPRMASAPAPLAVHAPLSAAPPASVASPAGPGQPGFPPVPKRKRSGSLLARKKLCPSDEAERMLLRAQQGMSCAPTPPTLDPAWVARTSRVQEAQGRMTAASAVPCAREVDALVSGAIRQFAQSSATQHILQAQVANLVHAQIMREVKGVLGDIQTLNKDLQAIDPPFQQPSAAFQST